MKTFVVSVSTFVLGVLLSFQAMGATAFPIKSCSSDVKKLDESGVVIPTTMTVYSDLGDIRGHITQTVDGKTTSYDDVAAISFFLIDHSIDQVTDSQIDSGVLNLGELLLAHAYKLVNDPELNGFFSAGLDLKAVRSVRVFQIGPDTEFGMTAIIEANDQTGKELGSFIGGFIVSPCK
jgi:hypothetical protein